MQNEMDQYREILLEHARHPKHMGEIIHPHGKGECRNPLCGDKISVTIFVEGQTIKDIKILPSGCSISTAAASLMAETVSGLTLDETINMVKLVNETFVPTNSILAKEEWPESLQKISPLKRIRENPLKIPCALISWVAVRDAVKDYRTKESSCLV